MNQEIKVTRKVLYNEVWTKPMQELAKKYGISDVALAKRCRRKNIPRPGRGYWAKVQAGQKPKRKPLPPMDDNEEIIISPYKARAEVKNKVVRNKVESLQKKGEKTSPILIPEKLLKPHPLVKITRKVLRLAKPDHKGWLWDRENQYLNISVSRKQLRRALIIMDTLIKELEKRGFKMATLDRHRESTAVVIMDEQIRFGIEEIYDVSIKPLPEWRKNDTSTIYNLKFRI